MVFFSKKQKKDMLARKKKASGKVSSSSSGNTATGAEPAAPVEIKLTMPTKEPVSTGIRIIGKESTGVSTTSAKPKAVPVPTNFLKIAASTIKINVPAELTGAALRDFRKKARREAKKNDQKIIFIEKDRPVEAEGGDAPAKKSFPKLNDLAARQAEAKVAKAAAAANDAKQAKIDAIEATKFLATQPTTEEQANYVALDCEMVGVGAGGKKSALARVSIVAFDGTVLMDQHVEVKDRVTDFRTHVSGVRASDLKGKGAVGMVTLRQAQMEVFQILKDKVLVGHALSNDFKALMMDHPKHMIRDTARYPPFMRKGGRNGGKLKPRKLRDLVKEILKVEDFQKAGASHDSTIDARMTMELYKVVRGDWEKEMEQKTAKALKAKAQRGGNAGEKCWKGMDLGILSDGEEGESNGEEDDAFDLSD
jgi:RNA exonuclease 4